MNAAVMKRKLGVVSVFTILLGVSFITETIAQDEDIFGIERKIRGRKSESELGNVFRNMVSNFSFELGAGGVYQRNQLQFNSNNPIQYPVYSILPDNPMDVEAGDTVNFSLGQMSVPVHAAVRLNLFEMLVLGAGYGREWGSMNPLRERDYRFEFQDNNYVMDRLFATAGLILYDANKRRAFLNWKYKRYGGSNHLMQSERKLRMKQDYPWRFILEGEYGQLFMRRGFDEHAQPQEPYYALGLRIERDFSEYTNAFIRPTWGRRAFSYQLPEQSEVQSINQDLFMIQFGVNVRLPGTKRCKVPGCGVVMKHLHNGVEYRGSSIWRMQNRKIGQWY